MTKIETDLIANLTQPNDRHPQQMLSVLVTARSVNALAVKLYRDCNIYENDYLHGKNLCKVTILLKIFVAQL